MSADTFSERLRMLKEERGLTAQEMSVRTGIPKRTLEKYMLKTGAAVPGLDAIKSICKAFDTSADWLIGLSERGKPAVSELDATEVAARAVFEHFVANVNHTQKWAEGGAMGSVFQRGLLYGADPGALADDYAYRVLKLRAEILQGNVETPIEVRAPSDEASEAELNLNPRSIFKMDEI